MPPNRRLLVGVALIVGFLLWSWGRLGSPAAVPADRTWLDLPICGLREIPLVREQAWAKTLRQNQPHFVNFVFGHPLFKMRLRPSNFDERMWMRLLNEQEYIFQMAAMRMIVANIVPEGEKCGVVDIGANAGYVSLAAAALGCRVDALEASPETAKNTQMSFDLNDVIGRRITMHHAAVSKAHGTVAFATLRGGSIYDRMVSDEEALTIGEKDDALFGRFQVHRVETKPVHEVVSSPVVHFVKLDCEGCEAQAIETMAPLLARGAIKVILSEWITKRIRVVSGTDSIATAVELLRKAEYRPYSYNGDPLAWDYLSAASTEVGDLFIVHDSVAKFKQLVAGPGGLVETWQKLQNCADGPGTA